MELISRRDVRHGDGNYSEGRRIVARVIVLSLKSFYRRRCRSHHALRQCGSASAHTLPFKGDRRRRIDRYLDYFGSAVPVLAALAVAGRAAPPPRNGVISPLQGGKP